MKTYGQFCPVAKTAEIISERWNLLILRELLMGSIRFSELRRGLGTISPSVLTERLRSLEEYGVIVRRVTGADNRTAYHLTEAGRALQPLVEAAGLWGYRWLRYTFEADDLDVDLLMLDISRRINTDRMVCDRAVIEFEFTDLESEYRTWWLLIDGDDVDLCFDHPGREVDVVFRSTLETLTRVWMKDLKLTVARRNKQLTVSGKRHLTRNIGDWFVGSHIAELAEAQK